MADNLEIFGETYPNATGIKAKDTNGVTQTFIKPSGTKTITGSGTTDVSAYANASVTAGSLVSTATYSITPSVSVDSDGLVTVSGETSTTNSPVYTSGWIANTETQYVTLSAANTYQLSTQAAKTVNPSTTSQTAVAAGKYTTGAVTVAAMPTMTLPTSTSASATSGYTSKATVSRSTSDQYINIPTGYNSAGAYYKVNAVANGTEGTPTATKGTVSNHSVTVTPSVTNTAGYISGGTKTGTAVTVSASELVSGSETKTANGTYDVTNLAELVVNVSGGSGTDTLTALLNNTLTTLTYNGTGTLPRDLCYDKTAITSISMPNITTVSENAFRGASGVTQCDFSSVTSVASYAFYWFGRGSLQTFHLPEFTTQTAGSYAFGGMGTSAKPCTVVLPKAATLLSDCFRGGYYAAIDLGPTLSSLPARAFYSTGSHPLVILRKSDAIVTLANANALTNLTASTTIYIPKALYDHLGDNSSYDYKANANWSAKAAVVTWAQIEGSQYENYYADGTAIS